VSEPGRATASGAAPRAVGAPRYWQAVLDLNQRPKDYEALKPGFSGTSRDPDHPEPSTSVKEGLRLTLLIGPVSTPLCANQVDWPHSARYL